MSFLTGKKIGQTHVFIEDGKMVPVTVIEAESLGDAKSKVDLFKAGDFVDVTGTSKGRGFQGGMKRWNWSGAPKSHGSMSHRRIGSVGASASPSRVLKGQHMPGHMGNRKVTIQNLEIIKLNKENNLLVIKGAVPGHRNSKLIIKKAKKKFKKEEVVEAKKPEAPKKAEEKTKAEAVKKKEEKAEKDTKK